MIAGAPTAGLSTAGLSTAGLATAGLAIAEPSIEGIDVEGIDIEGTGHPQSGTPTTIHGSCGMPCDGPDVQGAGTQTGMQVGGGQHGLAGARQADLRRRLPAMAGLKVMLADRNTTRDKRHQYVKGLDIAT